MEVERDQRVTGVQFQCLAHVLVWNRVVMLLVVHVVVDIDLDRLDIDIAVGVARQWFESRLVESLERLTAVARQLLERLTCFALIGQTRSRQRIADGIDLPAFTLDMISETGASGRQLNRQETWIEW